MKKAVQFGAGNIGRGFIGQLLFQSGYETTFIDVNEEVISAINRVGSYKINIVGEMASSLKVRNIKAINARDTEAVTSELVSADVAVTAVGNSVLEKIAPLIASGLAERKKKNIEKPLNIIICENLLGAGQVLRKLVLESLDKTLWDYAKRNLGLVESVVSRMVPVVPRNISEKDPLYIAVEEYCTLPVDREGFIGEIPDIKGMVPYENIDAYEERKIYTHNAGHSICAYLGYQKGYEFVWEALEDKEIYSVVTGALRETGEALIKKHGFNSQKHYEHVDDLLSRFANKALGDTICRVGRDPIRKLGPNDRLIGSAKLVSEYGIKPVNICKGIAAALKYDYSEDPSACRLANSIKQKGIDFVFKNICKIDPQSKIAKLVKGELI
ncbi:MAG: mannitol-1-phosphate 5-dehydrogenase [bacterium]|nr:mannitol-1-phosphate 5-dehydrogenase [bacterium]